MKTLKKDLESGIVSKINLFFGSEFYLMSLYEKRLKSLIIEPTLESFNLNVFEGSNLNADKIIDSIETAPFMADKRLLIIKNSGFFNGKNKNNIDHLIKILENLPESTIILFVEDTIDKRTKFFKLISKIGKVVEFSPLAENDLITWIKSDMKKNNVEISPKESSLLIRNLSGNMELISNEIHKLVSYKNSSGKVTVDDIENVCSKSLESKIFELIDSIGYKNTPKALSIYKNLLSLKESPIMIISMIGRQFRLLFNTYILKDKLTNEQMAKKLSLRSFMINAFLKQCGNFRLETLRDAVVECAELDHMIKTGRIEPELGVELIIIKYSNVS